MHRKWKTSAILIAVGLTTLLLVSKSVFAFRVPSLRAERLSTVTTPRGISARKLVRFGNGQCVVLCHPVTVHIPDLTSALERPGTSLVPHVLETTSRWYVGSDQQYRLSTFNCATYAIGEVIGLSKSDWLETSAVGETNFECPVEIVLENFFERVAVLPIEKVNWSELDQNAWMENDDIIVFFYRGNHEIEYVHLGKVLKQGRNLMVSKWGQGPILQGSIEETAANFAGGFTELHLYRKTQ